MYYIKLTNKKDFDEVTDWKLPKMVDYDIHIDIPNMTLTFINEEDKEGILNCIRMNLMEYEEGKRD